MSNPYIFNGGVYHIVCKANGENKLFRSHGDYEFFLTQLRKEQAAHPFRIYSWCLLPKVIHLLIEAGEDSPLLVMKHLLVKYAKHYERRYRLKGDLFEDRYAVIVVNHEDEIVEEGRDIHLLPLDLKEPYEDYRYSSYHNYVREDGGAGYRCLVDKTRVMKQFDYDAKEYRKYMQDEADHKQYGK